MTQADVLIQAGHSADFTPHIPGGGGAPYEAEWTSDTSRLLQARLASLPIPITSDIVGSWLSYNPITQSWTSHTPPQQVSLPYKLAYSIHYDADLSPIRPGYNTGWFWDRWEDDTTPAECDRFGHILESAYVQLLPEIPFHPERRNSNTRYYYAASSIIYAPFVIIECGVGQGLDKSILFDTPGRVVEAITKATCEFLSVPYVSLTAPQQPSPQPDPCAPLQEALRLANWRKFEFERYIREYNHRAETDDQAAHEGIAPIDLMLRWAQDHFNAGDQDPTP